MTATTAVDRLARWRHPQVSSTWYQQTPLGGARLTITVTPFTNHDPEPDRSLPPGAHDDADLTDADRDRLYEEYDLVWVAWQQQHYRAQMHDILTAAAPAWTTFQQARVAMAAAYDALSGDADQWRRTVLALMETHEAAAAAAQVWDGHAAALAHAWDGHYQTMGEHRESHFLHQRDLAAELGITDFDDWHIADTDRYRDRWGADTPAVEQVNHDIQAQVARIKRVDDLATDNDSDED